MAVKELGESALQGWRERAANAIAPALGRRTPLEESWIRSALGFLFLALTVRYLVRTVRAALAR